MLDALPGLSVVALHGESESLVRDTARRVLRAETGAERDPLRLAILRTCDERQVAAAMQSASLGGGRPVVWVADASDKLTGVAEDALRTGPAALLVLGFGARFEKSSLAGMVARHGYGCVVQCVPDEAMADREVLAVFGALGVRAVAAAVSLLVAWAEASGRSVGSVAEQAALLAGPGGTVDTALVARLGADKDGGSLGAGVRAGLTGDTAALDRTVGQAMHDGQSGVGLLRQALAQVQFSRAARVRQRPGAAGSGAIEAAAESLWLAERSAKRTGAPQDLLAAGAVRSLSRKV